MMTRVITMMTRVITADDKKGDDKKGDYDDKYDPKCKVEKKYLV